MKQELPYDELAQRVNELEKEAIERERLAVTLERFFDLSPDMICTGNLNGYFTTINSSLQRILGYSKDELFEKPFLEFVHADDIEKTRQVLVEANAGKKNIYIENRYRCKDGSYRWIDWHVLALKKENRFFAIGRDITERKQVEHTLARNLELLNLSESLTGLGCFERNWQTGEGFWSEGFYQLLGETPGDLDCAHTEFMKYVHPDDVNRVGTHIRETLKTRTSMDIEFQLVQAGGDIIHIHGKGRNFYDECGEPLRTIGTFLDITDRKQAEKRLRKSERRATAQRHALVQLTLDEDVIHGTIDHALRRMVKVMSSTLGVARAGVWMLSSDKSELRCLMRYEGDKHEYSSGDVLATIDFPRYFEAIKAENRIVAEDVQSDPRTNELKDFYLEPLGITSLLDVGIFVDGDLVGVVSFEHIGPRRRWLHDEEAFVSTLASLVGQWLVSVEREQAEEALRESEEKYRHLVENVGEAMLVAQDGRLVFSNPKTEELLDASKKEIQSEPFIEFVHPDDQAMVSERYNRRLRGETPPNRYEVRVVRKSGEVRRVDLNAVLIEWEGRPAALSFLSDITDQKQAEEEREKLRAQLTQAQKMESVGRLAGGVAHDFNNMLSVILGNTELALEQLDPEQPLHANLQEIQKAARRSSDVTRQLLAFARKETIAPKVLDLNKTVETMLTMLRRLIGEDIDLVWLPGEKLCPVRMDPSQIDQILANLSVNARDAIKGGGKLIIETGKATFDEAYCADHPAFLPGDFVLLGISDDGCGMNKETLNNLFEPFYTTKDVDKGTGLGLATVYGIVKQNKGFINVYSEPGRGTTFKIYLPQHIENTGPMREDVSVEPAVRGQETILLVEDEPAILKMTTMMLERLGYEVVAARTPGQSILLAGEYTGRIDLLITDVVMPEMNGRDLANTLSSLYPHLKCLFMSGYTADVIADHGVLDEGVDFIRKPFTKKELAVKIREVLEEAAVSAQQ